MRYRPISLCFFFLVTFASLILPAEWFTIETDTKGDFTSLTRHSAEIWSSSTFWQGSYWTRIGRDWMHPEAENDAVRAFCVPEAGAVRVTGQVKKLHLDGDGVLVRILHGDRELWRQEIEGKDGKGFEPDLEIAVQKGDWIRFVLNRRGSIACDTTYWAPVVSYPESGQKYSAAEAFSDKQGHGGWFYEMNGPSGEVFQPKIVVSVGEEQYRLISGDLPNLPDFDMFPSVLTEWIRDDHNLVDLERSIRDHLERCEQLLENREKQDVDCSKQRKMLEKLRNEKPDKELYLRTRLLKRSLLFSDPRLQFGEMLFVKSRPPAYTHLVGQYFGWNQRPGGGIYVLERPGISLKHRDVLRDALPPGHVLEPRLSYDARKIAFSHVAVPEQRIPWQSLEVNELGGGDHYYHLYEMSVEGSELRRLTEDRYDDMMPEYLPDGGLAFVSTRRKSYSRCFGAQFGKRWHSYTLFRMDADVGGRLDPTRITQLSFNDVNDWFPAVSNAGTLLFARWDYIDRDAVTHQNLWSMRPDGTNPLAVWGNAVNRPHCTFQAKAIPGSNKIVFIASAHHSITAGPVCLVDPAVGANSLEALTRITPGKFPEAEGNDIPEYYNAPWPLGEDLFLVAYSRDRLIFEPAPNRNNALGLYVLDDRGDRELLYRDERIGATNPIPIIPRDIPPIVSSQIDERLKNAETPMGEMSIMNVYDGLGDVRPGSLRRLRIVQIFPKTTVVANTPRVGVAGEENTRAVLGVVPIEEDGSAKFLVPAGKPVLFQVLDEDGFAYQTMRSTTSVMPGEQNSCIGCHEQRMKTPEPTSRLPIALRRPASELEPTPESGRPYGFVEMIQPILDAKCVECHNEQRADGGYDLSRRIVEHGHTASYVSLCRDRKMVPRYVERNQIETTVPGGENGALGSGLIRLLKNKHEGVELTPHELERFATWIDLNAVFYGSFDLGEMQLQREGKPIPMPELQ